MNKRKYIIFTDLDGTLLDHDTYKFDEANQALHVLKEQQIPVVLCSSKTKVEMIGYQKEMGIDHYPFIVENGSSIFTKKQYFNLNDQVKSEGNFDCYNLGKSYLELVGILEKITEKYGYQIYGFHNTAKEEIIKRTLLDEEAVKLAMQREFSIPLFYDDEAKEILLKEINKYNLRILYGGRFMHLLGNTDKGKALKLAKKGFQNKYNSNIIKTIAIGDTLNDAAMLKAADIKILVKRYNNEHDSRVQIENITYSPYIGPKGWNHSILKILRAGV